MKIILTTDTIQRGGKERQLFLLAKELIKREYTIYIVSLTYSDKNYVSEYSIDSNIIHIVGESSIFKKYQTYKEIILRLNPDLVFSWDMQTALFSLPLFKKYKFAFINGSIQHGIRLFRISHLLRSLILWLSPYRLANSEAGLMANNLISNKRNFILYNGVELKFTNKYYNSFRIEKINQIIPNYTEGTKLFISVANFVPYKDYHTVLEALARIKHKYDFFYIVIGDGPLRRKILQKIKDLELEKNILLLGRVENVNEYLRLADYFIHSSRGEGLSNAILEAMFAGLPIIATHVGGTPELVYKNSFKLFNYKDISGLEKILFNVDGLFKDFNSDSDSYINHLNKFSVYHMVSNFEQILQKIVSY